MPCPGADRMTLARRTRRCAPRWTAEGRAAPGQRGPVESGAPVADDHPQAVRGLGIPFQRHAPDSDPGLPGSRVCRHVRQGLAHGVRDRPDDRCGDSRTPASSASRWTVTPGRACRRQRRAPRRSRSPEGRAGSGAQVVGAECGLHQGHVLPAPGHHLGHGIAARARHARERVEDRVVHQALMLAAFYVPAQDGVLVPGSLVSPVQVGVRRGRAAVEQPAARRCARARSRAARSPLPPASGVGNRLQHRAGPEGQRRSQRQQHGSAPGATSTTRGR